MSLLYLNFKLYNCTSLNTLSFIDVCHPFFQFEYRKEKKAKKKAYKELKAIARSEGKEPPPNPYPSAIKEIQAEEKQHVMDRFCNPKVIEIANKMKEERDTLLRDRAASGQW
jgi:small subunit ribosomal protein S23